MRWASVSALAGSLALAGTVGRQWGDPASVDHASGTRATAPGCRQRPPGAGRPSRLQDLRLSHAVLEVDQRLLGLGASAIGPLRCKQLTREVKVRIGSGEPAFLAAASASSPGGARFQAVDEQRLYPVASLLATKLVGAARGLTIVSEVPGPSGIADLVALPGDTRLLHARLSAGFEPLTREAEIRVAAALYEGRGLTLTAVRERTDLPAAIAERALRDLVRSGAALRIEDRFFRHPALRPVGTLYALEVKVRDWRKAMGQAFRYRAWCAAAGIVVDRLPQSRDSAVRQAIDLGLGIGTSEGWIVRPRVHPLSASSALAGSERFVAAVGAVSRLQAFGHQSPSARA